MSPYKLMYALKEAVKHLKRNLSTSFCAIVTIFLSMFIMGVFVVGGKMVSNAIGTIESRVTIQAFISDSAVRSEVQLYQDELSKITHVKEVRFKDKDEALAEYKKSMASSTALDAVAQLDGQNPLPASFIIKLDDPKFVSEVAQKIIDNEAFKKICDTPQHVTESVQYGKESVAKLFSLSRYLRIFAAVLELLLLFSAMTFIHNTIRLSVMARKREIAIMRLVGASNGFIRGPFIAEGLIQALFGSCIAIGSIEILRIFIAPRLIDSLSFLSFEVSGFEYMKTYALILGIGLLIGLSASARAMRRYLKV